MSVSLDAVAEVPLGGDGPRSRGGRSRAVRLPRSPKIIAGLAILGLFVVMTVIGPWVAPYDPSADSTDVLAGMSAHHLLGTTQQGQDVLSQVLVGARSTVLVGLVAGAIATVLAVIVGVSAGYLGGWVDDVLSLLSNVFLVVPALPLLIVLNAYLPAGGKSNLTLIAAIISLTGWAWGARVLRAQTMSMRGRDYIESARVAGERGWRIITFEILPNLLAVVASSFLFTVLYAVGTYVALSFLGVIDPSTPWSWGGMLFWCQSQEAWAVGAWHWFVPPALCVALLGTALALVNFGIDEFINPRLRAAGISRKAVRRAGVRSRGGLGLTPVVRRTAAPPAPAGAGAATPTEGGDR